MSAGGIQLTLALDLPPALSRDDFLVGPANAAALAAIDAWPDWPNGALLLTGPPGAGKTHLAEIWRAASGAGLIAAAGLPFQDADHLLDAGALVVEDIDRGEGLDRALFHLLNRARERGAGLLLTARDHAAAVDRALPDLASRLRAMRPVAVEAPNDALLERLLVKLFADRQLIPAPDVIPYLLPRMDRSFAAAGQLVRDLDAASMAENRPITRRLAATILDAAIDES